MRYDDIPADNIITLPDGGKTTPPTDEMIREWESHPERATPSDIIAMAVTLLHIRTQCRKGYRALRKAAVDDRHLREMPSRLKNPWVYPRASDPSSHVSYSALRPHFEKAVELAGLGDFHWHDLRHTFASRAVMAGVDLMTVANWLGHKSLAMMTRYAHLAPEHHKASLAKVAEKFRGATPLPPNVTALPLKA